MLSSGSPMQRGAQTFENGEPGSKTDPNLNELVETLAKCRTHLLKFTGYGWLMRFVRSEDIPGIIEHHSKALERWLASVPQTIPDAVLDEEDMQTVRFEEEVSRRQSRPERVPIVNPDHLEVGDEVGKFPFGTIHKGTYNGGPAYVRKIDEHIRGVPLDLVRGSKVEIARKVADTIMAMHDVAVGNGVILRDIRVANILINKGQNGEDELEPKITGFEMCKRDTYETGDYREFDKQTSDEPEDGDLIEMEGMKICDEYTKLMKRCLNGHHHNARPKIDEVVQELLSIEIALMGAEKKP
ncbi:hypothetical protein BG006_009179 [Podila minutissima]|uniref:Protein kinase domain-containing protein n=1 Tax=Podila minutissima TaxID=64525 RepID=A0A9P5SHR1_9FUNG|nr:hypothetical protein BG006_009179 [Podila minutissima]